VNDVDDAYLVRRAQEGFLDAYAELAERYTSRAYHTALRMLGNHHDAQDVTQDALVAAWQGIGQFKAESSFATWLYRIVTNQCLNRINRAHPTQRLDAMPEIAADQGGPAERAEQSMIVDAVAVAIAALPGPQRVALVLHQFERLSYAQIAEVTETTVPAVRSHLHRARRTLATTLREWR
jgi:RNA polymerase sigma-70 factor (ECF subfamily)